MQTVTYDTFTPQPGCLKQKRILLTGASRGIGRAVAQALAGFGAELVLLSRDSDALIRLADDISANGGHPPLLHPFNLCSASPSDYQDLHDALAAQWPALDGLIHVAGMLGQLMPLEHHDTALWYQTLQVNLNARFILTKICLPLLKQATCASVVFTDSSQALHPKPFWGAYAVAAAGSHTLRQLLGSETAGHVPIRANTVVPPAVDTRLRMEAYPAEDPSHLLPAAAITGVYVYLMADASQEISNQQFEARPNFVPQSDPQPLELA